MIKNTQGHIAFQRSPEAGRIFDYNIWLINTETGKEIQLTKDLRYWEYYPVWLSDSELLYLIEPQEKTMTETDIVYVNFNTGKCELLDFWTWENDPWMDKVSVDSFRNIYYATFNARARQFTVSQLELAQKEFWPKEVISTKTINQFGLARASSPMISQNRARLILIGCDTSKFRRLKKSQTFNYDLYLYDFESKASEINRLHRLTYGDYDNDDPVWLDNNNIIFTSNRDGNYELYLMNIINEKLKRLTFFDDTEDTRPDVSPDGNQIAYTRFFTKTDKHEIWIMDLETRKTWFLTEGSAPDWSPAK